MDLNKIKYLQVTGLQERSSAPVNYIIKLTTECCASILLWNLAAEIMQVN